MALDVKTLKDEAKASTGLSNFGDAPMDEGLERLVWSLNNEAKVEGKHEQAARGQVLGCLRERLKVEACLAEHPQILNEEVARPLFVISMPRTGSTATSQFLSEDPNARSIRRWECNNATPPPDAAIGDADPRFASMAAEYAEIYRQQPERRGMLPVDAGDPSEHGPILGLTFQNLQVPSLFHVPSWTNWCIESDLVPSYAYLKKVLQILQWKTPASHWNLKNPPDIFGLDALLKVFPDARLLWVHRDPVKSIPSVSSLTSMIRVNFGDPLDRKTVGPAQIAFQTRGTQLCMAVEQGLPAGRVVHMFQKDLARDTVGAIEAAYGKLGIPFTEDYRRHLTRRVEVRERPSHAYTLEEYGLTVDMIRTAFKDYLNCYGVPLEAV